MVRLTWKDGIATLAVAAATIGYLLWSADAAFTGLSTRGAAVAVFALGMVGCTSISERMAPFYGAEGHDRAPLGLLVVTSVAGGVALVTGLVAMIAGSTTMLAGLVVSTFALWMLATAHHLVPEAGHHGHHVGVRH